MSAKAGKRPLRSLTPIEKLDAIRRVHDGESKASVARDIGVPESTLRGWCKNEEKISYLSRQTTSPENSQDSLEPKTKKIKTEESQNINGNVPYNLSMKISSYSPTDSDSSYVLDFSKSKSDEESPKSTNSDSPLNLQVKIERPETPRTSTTPPQTQPTPAMSESTRRAKLAQMSVELGLNRPETVLPPIPAASVNASVDLSMLAQYSYIYEQQKKYLASQKQKTVSSPLVNGVNSNNYTQPLLSTANKHHSSSTERSSPRSSLNTSSNSSKDKSVSNETLWYLMHTNLLSNMIQQQISATSANSNGTPSVSVPTSSNSASSLNYSNLLADPNWVWNYVNRTAFMGQVSQTAASPVQPSVQVQNQAQSVPVNANQNGINEKGKQILYQQLTKEKDIRNPINGDVENHKKADEPEEKHSILSKHGSKGIKKERSTLDELLLYYNNNNNVVKNTSENPTLTIEEREAVEHGEIFLKWVEAYEQPPPSVTAFQILQLRSLLANIKSGKIRKTASERKHPREKRK